MGSPYFQASHWGEALLVARTAKEQSHNIRCTSSGRCSPEAMQLFIGPVSHWSKNKVMAFLPDVPVFFFENYLLEPFCSQFAETCSNNTL